MLTLHEYHLLYHYSLYHIEMLINSLTDIITGVGFQPKEHVDESITYYMILLYYIILLLLYYIIIIILYYIILLYDIVNYYCMK